LTLSNGSRNAVIPPLSNGRSHSPQLTPHIPPIRPQKSAPKHRLRARPQGSSKVTIVGSGAQHVNYKRDFLIKRAVDQAQGIAREPNPTRLALIQRALDNLRPASPQEALKGQVMSTRDDRPLLLRIQQALDGQRKSEASNSHSHFSPPNFRRQGGPLALDLGTAALPLAINFAPLFLGSQQNTIIQAALNGSSIFFTGSAGQLVRSNMLSSFTSHIPCLQELENQSFFGRSLKFSQRSTRGLMLLQSQPLLDLRLAT